ncbi:MAG: tetratricopeptide repeat protein [Nitrospirota bacterium]
MEKDKLPDIIDITAAIGFLSFLLLFSGCISLPRIIILNDPLTTEEHISLGVSYESEGKLDLALSEYKEALRKEPDYAIALIYIGNVYYQKGDYEKAKWFYKDALKREPDNGGLYNNLSWVYISQNKDMDEAERLIKKAIDVDPNNRVYYLDTLASIYIKTGRFNKALERLQEAGLLVKDDNEELKRSIEDNIKEIYKKTGESY